MKRFNLLKDIELKVIIENYKKQYPNVFKFYELTYFYIFGNVGLQLIPLTKGAPTLMFSDFIKLEKRMNKINNYGIVFNIGEKDETR